MVKALTCMGVDVWISALAISTLFAVLSTVAFQKVAESYLPKEKALKATLLYFLFPIAFVFSTVCYTEPVFLLFSILSWYFHLLRRRFESALSMALTTVSRPNGILVTIPIAYDCLRKKKVKDLSYLLFPVSTLLGWSLYGYLITGDMLVLLDARSQWETERTRFVWAEFSKLIRGETSVISTLRPYLFAGIAGLGFIALILSLSYGAWRLDRALGLYCFASTLAIICFGISTSYVSIPRFLSFLFPLGLGLNFKNRLLFVAILICFLALDYVAWLAFLTSNFLH
jgi:hypothetical protein